MIIKRTGGWGLLASVVLVAACGGSETSVLDDGGAGSATGGTAGTTGGTQTGTGGAGAGGSAGGIVDGSSGSGGVATGGAAGAGMTGGSGGAMGGSGGVATGGSGGVATGGSGGAGMTGGTAGQGGSDGGVRDGSLGRVPAQHRAMAEACDHERPATIPLPMNDASYYMCHSDADCTAGENGRCTSIRFGSACSYDTCFVDGDCTISSDAGTVTRRTCKCGGAASNVCTGGGCQTDADCNGRYCSPTFGSCGNYNGVVSYECHTAADECTDDADCVGLGDAGASFGGAPYCAFSPAVGHWKCEASHCVG